MKALTGARKSFMYVHMYLFLKIHNPDPWNNSWNNMYNPMIILHVTVIREEDRIYQA